jgi:hypothetical protein
VPCRHADSAAGDRAHICKRRSTASPARRLAGDDNGGTPLPASAQAARATCHLARGAATQRWSFLTNFFKGGLF